MRAAYLEDADRTVVSDAVVSVLKERDALVTAHTASRVRFKGLNPGDAYAFPRGGYVGTYQHAGERSLELRLDVAAVGPRRTFWVTVGAAFTATVAFFALQPPAGAWGAVGGLLWALFLASFIVYLGTWRASWSLERDLLAAVEDRVAAAGDFVHAEEREIARLEDELEAEVLALKLKADAKARGRERPEGRRRAKPRRRLKVPFNPFAKPVGEATASPATDAQTEDEKRARVEALRAEIARRKRELDARRDRR